MIKRLLLCLGIIFTFSVQVARGDEKTDGLKTIASPSNPIAWWPLDERKGNIVHDRSGHGRTGTLVGARWKKEEGHWSLWFDGIDDCVVIGADERLLPVSGVFTVSAWINQDDMAHTGSVASWDWQDPFGLFIEQTTLRAMVNIEGEKTLTDAPNVLVAKRWYHILMSYDGQHIREYVDGQLAKDRDFLSAKKLFLGNRNLPERTFLIGIGNQKDRYQPFRGKIRDVKVWHRSLTSDEVAGEYQRTIGEFAEARFENRPSDKVYFCPRKSIVPGGPASQWDGIPVISLGKDNVYNTVSLGIERREAGPLSWHGLNDLSGRAWFAHDDKCVYVRLKITDDVHVAYPGEGLWRGDSVQIAFDTLNDKSNNYCPDDYEYGFSLVQGEVHKVCFAKAKGTGKTSGKGLDSIQCRIVREKDNTCYEFAFSYDSLYPFDSHNGVLGLSFIINDNDGSNRKGWLQLTPGIGDGKNPSEFASLLLTDQNWGFYFDRDKLDHVQATQDILLRLTLSALKKMDKTVVRVNVKNDEQQIVFSRTVHQSIQPGQNIFTWTLKSGTLEPGAYQIEGIVEGISGREKKIIPLLVISKKNILHELRDRFKNVEAAQNTLNQKIAQIESEKKVKPSYPAAAASVVSVFFPLISNILVENDPEWKAVDQAAGQIKELENILSDQIRLSDDILSGKQEALVAPSYISGTVEIHNGSFIGKVRVGDKLIENYPIIFQGFNLFSRQWQHLELIRKCGFNLIQIETGIWSIFPAENKINEDYVLLFRQYLDKAGELGVAVDLMLSPHYYPEWMAEKYPKLREQGWLFSDAPENHALLKKYVEYLVSQLKEGKGLITICLANEPGFHDSGTKLCPESLSKWSKWLKHRHGTIDALNNVYGTAYQSFDEVKPPPSNAKGASQLDWSWFFQCNFADWHRSMADYVHQVDPAIPVHTKFLIDWILLESDRNVVRLPELFSEVTDINGHDEWANIWASFCSDLQRSVANKPIFNSENHLIPDYYEGDVSPESIRLALWREVLHGLCASVIWAWDWYNPKDKSGTELFTGNIMYRPACLMEASKVALDMMRLSPEITLLQNQEPGIFILWSPSDITYRPHITSLILKTYEACHLVGQRIGFITEQQLEKGKDISGRAIVIPGTVHLSTRAFSTLKNICDKNETDLVFVGSECLTLDEYGRNRSDLLKPAWTLNPDLSTQKLWKNMYSRYRLPEIELQEEGMPAWNIEYRTARNSSGLFILLLNHDTRDRKIQIKIRNGYPELFDMVSGTPENNPISLQQQGIRLLKVK